MYSSMILSNITNLPSSFEQRTLNRSEKLHALVYYIYFQIVSFLSPTTDKLNCISMKIASFDLCQSNANDHECTDEFGIKKTYAGIDIPISQFFIDVNSDTNFLRTINVDHISAVFVFLSCDIR